MNQALPFTSHLKNRIGADANALLDFLYGTPKRTRMTLGISFAIFAYVTLSNALLEYAQSHGACVF